MAPSIRGNIFVLSLMYVYCDLFSRSEWRGHVPSLVGFGGDCYNISFCGMYQKGPSVLKNDFTPEFQQG